MINPKDVLARGFRTLAPPPEMRVQWIVPADLPYFAGHFPGSPTLPAVAMIDLTLELMRQWPGYKNAEVSAVKSAKFSAVIGPGTEVEIKILRDAASPLRSEGIDWRAEWKIIGGEVAASFLLGAEIEG